jgi:multisubunit Na+/H+ antiporter MnhB subunit
VLNTYNTARKNNGLTSFEILVLGLAALFTLAAILMYFTNKTYFEMLFNPDGGFAGYVTVFLLIVIFGVSITYVVRLSRFRSIQFNMVLILAGLLSLLFVVEIMGGLPDIFHASTHHLFKTQNAFLHTGASNVIKINETGKIAFRWVLIAAGAFYFLALPFIYRNNFNAKRFIDKTGIPIPHRNHIMVMIILTVFIVLFSVAINSAILSLNLSAVFLLVLLCPENIGVFRR